MTRLTLLALSLLCLSLVSNKAKAEGDTNVQAQPNAVGNSSIINQNMNVNNGMTGKLQFGNLVCSQPTMAVTPFYTGNEHREKIHILLMKVGESRCHSCFHLELIMKRVLN